MNQRNDDDAARLTPELWRIHLGELDENMDISATHHKSSTDGMVKATVRITNFIKDRK